MYNWWKPSVLSPWPGACYCIISLSFSSLPDQQKAIPHGSCFLRIKWQTVQSVQLWWMVAVTLSARLPQIDPFVSFTSLTRINCRKESAVSRSWAKGQMERYVYSWLDGPSPARVVAWAASGTAADGRLPLGWFSDPWAFILSEWIWFLLTEGSWSEI